MVCHVGSWYDVPIDKPFLRNAVGKKRISPRDTSGCSLFIRQALHGIYIYIHTILNQAQSSASSNRFIMQNLSLSFPPFFIPSLASRYTPFPSARFAVIAFNITLIPLIPPSTRKCMFRFNVTSRTKLHEHRVDFPN